MQITQKSSQLKKSGLRLISGSASISPKLLNMLEFLYYLRYQRFYLKVILQSYLRFAMQYILYITQIEQQSWNQGVYFRNYSPGCVYRISLKRNLKSYTVANFLFGSEHNSQKARQFGDSDSKVFHNFRNYARVIFYALGLLVHLAMRIREKQVGIPTIDSSSRLLSSLLIQFVLSPIAVLMEVMRVFSSAGFPLGKQNCGIQVPEIGISECRDLARMVDLMSEAPVYVSFMGFRGGLSQLLLRYLYHLRVLWEG